MRICHVAPELLPVPPTKGGAIERWVRDAAVRLTRRGHEVHVVSREAGGPSTASGSPTIDGVHYHYVHIPTAIDRGLAAGVCRGAWYYTRVRRVLERIAPDIVHHHSRPAGLWLSASSRIDARYVISLHSMDYGWGFGHRAWDRPLFARGFRVASRVLCVSHFIERHTAERYPELRLTTVYNGVDGELFQPASGPQDLPPSPQASAGQARPQALNPSSPQALQILYVGRVEARKGVKVLVDAFEQVISKRVPDARLRIVGPHSYWDAQPSGYYRQIADRCAANPHIELCEPTYVDEELAQIYRDAAVSVVPSVFPEALGLTSIEAQASGTPVVVSDAGGLPETVSVGESGLVFENGNVQQLGNAVVELLASASRRQAMAKAARAWAMTTFSWDVIAADLERVYAEALEAPVQGAA